MARSKLTSKGQTTIPMLVRERLGLSVGDAMDFVFQPDGSVSLRAVKRDLLSLEGMLAKPGRPAVTLEEMDAAIRARAVKRHTRPRKTTARRRP
jgi:AbrB family looped-hinge helix DNA binding protein